MSNLRLEKQSFYQSSNEFVTAEEAIKYGVPRVLFSELETEKEKLTALADRLTVTRPDEAGQALRQMSPLEIEEVETSCMDLMKYRIPDLETEIEKLENEFKGRLRDLKSLYSAARTEARNLALESKIGTKLVDLDNEKTFRIFYKEHFLYYSLINLELVLVKVTQLTPDQLEQSDMVNSIEEDNFSKFLAEQGFFMTIEDSGSVI